MALRNLTYFVHTNNATFHRIINHSKKCEEDWDKLKYYIPFAVSGINITYMLLNMFCLNRCTDDNLEEKSACIYTAFLNLLEVESYAFEEVYCSAFLALFEIWMQEECEYMNFSESLDRVSNLVSWVLAERKPESIRDFLTAMRDAPEEKDRIFTAKWESNDCCLSVHE